MDFTHKALLLVGSFGLVAPHAGVEVQLLISGCKPIGMICSIDLPTDSSLSPDELQEHLERKLLDQAVTEGKLSRHITRIPPQVHWHGLGGNAYFYCQKGREADMLKLANFHLSCWKDSGAMPFLAKDVGFYFGYTKEDIRLFQNGGYDSLGPITRFLMKRTHKLRKIARIRTLLEQRPNDHLAP